MLSSKTRSEDGPSALLATFYIRDALCALDASKIHEVIRVGLITPVRHAPAGITGIVNLRGRIVTVLDLGLRLGLPGIVPCGESRIFIMEDGGEFIGLLVDRVDEVIETNPSGLQTPPPNIAASHARFVRGICRTPSRVITVLDTSTVLSEPPR